MHEQEWKECETEEVSNIKNKEERIFCGDAVMIFFFGLHGV